MLRLLIFCLMAALGLSSAEAGTFSSFPPATEPLGGAEVVPMDQGSGCPFNVQPCVTSQAPSARLGQPVQTTCAAIVLPFQFQYCIDTSLSPPVLKQYLGTAWVPIEAPVVATNAALKALPGGIVTGVYRQGFAAAGDGGAMSYSWSPSPCPLTAGAGDDGSQVAPLVGTGCWLWTEPTAASVQVWGARFNNLTDDTGAFNKACAATAGLPIWLTLPAGTSKIFGAITCAGKVKIVGAGGNGLCATILDIVGATHIGLTLNGVGNTIQDFCVTTSAVARTAESILYTGSTTLRNINVSNAAAGNNGTGIRGGAAGSMWYNVVVGGGFVDGIALDGRVSSQNEVFLTDVESNGNTNGFVIYGPAIGIFATHPTAAGNSGFGWLQLDGPGIFGSAGVTAVHLSNVEFSANGANISTCDTPFPNNGGNDLTVTGGLNEASSQPGIVCQNFTNFLYSNVFTDGIATLGGLLSIDGDGALISNVTFGAIPLTYSGITLGANSRNVQIANVNEDLNFTQDTCLTIAPGAGAVTITGWNTLKCTTKLSGTLPTGSSLSASPGLSSGSWSPTITTTGTVGTPAYAANGRVGHYEIVGNEVIATGTVNLSGWAGGPTGNVDISGLPLTSANVINDDGVCSMGNFTVTGLAANNYSMSGIIGPNTGAIILQQNGNTGSSVVTAAQVGVTPVFIFSCVYHF